MPHGCGITVLLTCCSLDSGLASALTPPSSHSISLEFPAWLLSCLTKGENSFFINQYYQHIFTPYRKKISQHVPKLHRETLSQNKKVINIVENHIAILTLKKSRPFHGRGLALIKYSLTLFLYAMLAVEIYNLTHIATANGQFFNHLR